MTRRDPSAVPEALLLTEGPPIPPDVPADRIGWDVARTVVALVGRGYGLRVAVTPAPRAVGAHVDAVVRQLQGRGCAVRVLPGTAREVATADVVVDLGDGEAGSAEAARGSRRAGPDPSGDAVVVAAGLPSGVAASGAVAPGAAGADVTLTWGTATRAVLLYPGRAHVGDLIVRSPWAGAQVGGWRALTVAGASPGPYDMDTDKGDRGTVLAIAGSRESAGAAAATGVAALGSGAGLVAVATPAPAHLVLSMQHPGLRVLPLTSEDGRLAEASLSQALDEVDRYQVVVAGPGLAPQPVTRQLVDRLRGRAQRLVLDADALTVHADDPSPLEDHVGDLVLTPNAAELARLGGRPAPSGPRRHEGETAEQAPGLARRYRATIVAKGTRTVVAAPDGRVWTTPTGNPALSTGGSGDILAGMVAASIAGADDVPLAAARAAWWHGLVGDVVAERALGRASATDLLSAIPGAFGRMGDLAVRTPLFPFDDRLPVLTRPDRPGSRR